MEETAESRQSRLARENFRSDRVKLVHDDNASLNDEQDDWICRLVDNRIQAFKNSTLCSNMSGSGRGGRHGLRDDLRDRRGENGRCHVGDAWNGPGAFSGRS